MLMVHHHGTDTVMRFHHMTDRASDCMHGLRSTSSRVDDDSHPMLQSHMSYPGCGVTSSRMTCHQDRYAVLVQVTCPTGSGRQSLSTLRVATTTRSSTVRILIHVSTMRICHKWISHGVLTCMRSGTVLGDAITRSSHGLSHPYHTIHTTQSMPHFMECGYARSGMVGVEDG